MQKLGDHPLVPSSVDKETGEILSFKNQSIVTPQSLMTELSRAQTVDETRLLSGVAKAKADLAKKIPGAYDLAWEYGTVYLHAVAQAGRQLGEAKRGAPKGNKNAGKQKGDVSPLFSQTEIDRRKIERKMAACEASIDRYAYSARENAEVPNVSGCLKFQDIGGVSLSSGFHEWYTPPEWVNASRTVMGSIDLDPASCAEANTIVQAKTYYEKPEVEGDENGWERSWFGNVYCNPPYSAPLVLAFASKMREAYETKEIKQGIFLVHHATDAGWWQLLASAGALVSFPDGRINFIDGRTMTTNAGSSIRGQSIFYLGPNRKKFIERFSGFGVVCQLAE